MTDKLDTSPKAIGKFALLFAFIALAIGAYAAYKGHAWWSWFLLLALFFLVGRQFFPSMLRPIYIGWMKFAFVLGWINTRILLGVFYYVILTPGSIVMRLMKRDVLNRKFDREAETYWVQRQDGTRGRERYERQF